MKTLSTYYRHRMALFNLVPVFILILLAGCKEKATEKPYSTLRGEIFGTWYSISLVGDSSTDLEQLHHEVDSLLDLINLTFSTYDSISVISAFNSLGGYDYDALNEKIGSTGREAYVNELFRRCLRYSKEAYRNTEGAFDPTAGRLFNIWGFAEGQVTRVPNSDTVLSVLSMKGLDKIDEYVVSTENTTVVAKGDSDSMIQLNYNAIAKGLAVDEIAQFLERKGVEDYLVEIGGEMRVSGVKRNGDKWTIGINKPSPEAGVTEVIVYLNPASTGIATSGNYRNYYESDGVLYTHIIDPRTGYPAQTDLLSATVFHPGCAMADAYATAFMVMGSQQAQSVADQLDLDYVFIVQDTTGTSGFRVISSEKATTWIHGE